jgi:hypothetical protein
MTEQPKNKELTIKIDTSEAEKRIRSEYEARLAEKDSAIKELQNSHMESERPAPVGGDTCTLEQNEKARTGNSETFHIDWENSELDPSWVKGKNEAEVIAVTEDLAKKGNIQAIAIIQKLTRKILHSSKPLSIEFQGSSKDFLKSPMPIPELASEADRNRIEKHNSMLKANRQNWKNLSED